VTLVDASRDALQKFEETLDIRAVHGSSCHAAVLAEAGVDKADVVVAATDQDEINLLTATIAKRMGALRAVVRIHHRTYIDRASWDYGKYLDIDHLLCPEHLTAMLIARGLSNPGATAIERFAQDRIEMQQYTVGEKSAAIGVKLVDLELPSGVRLATIRRGNMAFMPDRATTLQAGDVATVIGETRHAERVNKLFHRTKRAALRVVLMGGTSTAVWLARALDGPNFSVRLFEIDRARAEELSEKLPHVTVLHADPTDPTVFQEEHIDQSNVFIGISGNDEQNILAALQAKAGGAQQTIVVVQQSTYLTLLTQLGIDFPFSPRIEAAKQVLQIVDDAPVRRLATLAETVADVYELGPVRQGAGVGQPLTKIRLPKGAFVAAVQRQEAVQVPLATDVIETGDQLIVIGPQGIEKKLRELFIGK
jgi:trk system potassium uptake protein TrkA